MIISSELRESSTYLSASIPMTSQVGGELEWAELSLLGLPPGRGKLGEKKREIMFN